MIIFAFLAFISNANAQTTTLSSTATLTATTTLTSTSTSTATNTSTSSETTESGTSTKTKTNLKDLPILVIVHPGNPLSELSVKELSDFYFKRNRYWADGSKVRFFDQKNNSTEKNLFIEKILKKTPRDIDLFWIGEKNFSGQGAPIIAPNDDMVISSVASLPGAIGYISDRDADLSHVKKITLKGSE